MENRSGQYYFGFGARINKKALSLEDGSRYTNDVLKLITQLKEETGNVTLPRDLLQAEFHMGGNYMTTAYGDSINKIVAKQNFTLF